MKKCNIDRSHYLFDNQALVSLIVPLIIEQLLTVLVGMADSIMVANVGEAAVSGVSLVDQIMVLLINIFAALATGGAVVAGQYLGQKNKEQACKSTTQLMWSMGFISLVITAFVYACKYWILHGVFGQIEADVMHHADVYLLIVTASIPFIALYNGGAAVFRAMGNSEVSMKVSLLMNAINVSGNARAVKHVFKMRWHTPYARYLWNGDVMYGNPTERRYGPKKISFTSALAHEEWAKYAREVYGEQWKQVFQAALKRRLK